MHVWQTAFSLLIVVVFCGNKILYLFPDLRNFLQFSVMMTSRWTNKILTVEFLLFHIPAALACGYFVPKCFIDFKVSLTFWEYWFIYVTYQGTFLNICEHFGYFLVVPTVVIFMGKIWSHPSGWCFSLPSTSCGDLWRMLSLSDI